MIEGRSRCQKQNVKPLIKKLTKLWSGRRSRSCNTWTLIRAGIVKGPTWPSQICTVTMYYNKLLQTWPKTRVSYSPWCYSKVIKLRVFFKKNFCHHLKWYIYKCSELILLNNFEVMRFVAQTNSLFEFEFPGVKTIWAGVPYGKFH